MDASFPLTAPQPGPTPWSPRLDAPPAPPAGSIGRTRGQEEDTYRISGRHDRPVNSSRGSFSVHRFKF